MLVVNLSSIRRGGDESGLKLYEAYTLDDSSEDHIELFDQDQTVVEDFRSAFFDEDSGEIYEGGSVTLFPSYSHPSRWIAGARNGKGVCLYADGTLYEGFWVRHILPRCDSRRWQEKNMAMGCG